MKNKEIICVMCIHNESLNLKECLEHLNNYVDKFVVFDDESTDNSIEILKQFPKVANIITEKQEGAHRWRERHNRETVIRRAKEVSDADETWVLCIDPDERFEMRFLEDIRKIIDNNPGKAISIHMRELWDAIDQYRNDGIWDRKRKTLLFPLSDKMTYDYENEHHNPWTYRELTEVVELDYSLYHLKMIKEEDREERRQLYNRLDPNKKMQAIGYDYLVDKKDLSIAKIKSENSYDYETVPNYYKK